jgi:phosphoribosyl isomerase A
VSFTLLPAVDVTGGRVARFGDNAALTSSDPLEVALAFQAAGAEWIHLVDLDAAFGSGSNTELLAAVVGELDIKVELAGGIRNDASLEWALKAVRDIVPTVHGWKAEAMVAIWAGAMERQ